MRDDEHKPNKRPGHVKMDLALMKEREAFLKKALSNTQIEKRRPDPLVTESKKKSSKPASSNTDVTSYKSSSGSSSQYNFKVLANVVRHMKKRHQEGECHALSIDEILDETSQLNIGPKCKNWLVTEALPNNPKIQEEDGKYLFKPPLPVRDRKTLLKLLRQHDMKGLGGIMTDDIQESVPHFEKVMRNIDKEILKIIRQTDKKQIVFYNDRSLKFDIDKEFQQLWRNTSVDGLQDDNIDEYLKKQGIKSMQETAPKIAPIRKRTKTKRQRTTKITDNDHLSHVLQTYDDT